LYNPAQSTNVREFEDRFIETQPHEEFRSDKLQLIEGNEQVFNEPLIIESENCNSDNEDDKENVNDRKRKQLFVKKCRMQETSWKNTRRVRRR